MRRHNFHAVIDLTGDPQQLSDGLQDFPIRWIALTADPANVNPVYRGFSANLSASIWGQYIPAAAATVPAPPDIMAEFEDGRLNLSDIWVLGTAGEKLHINVIGYI